MKHQRRHTVLGYCKAKHGETRVTRLTRECWRCVCERSHRERGHVLTAQGLGNQWTMTLATLDRLETQIQNAKRELGAIVETVKLLERSH